MFRRPPLYNMGGGVAEPIGGNQSPEVPTPYVPRRQADIGLAARITALTESGVAVPQIPQTGNDPVRASFTTTPAVTVAGSAVFLASNPKRRYLLIQNNSAANIGIGFNAAGSALTLQLTAGLGFEWYGTVPTDSINVWAAAAGGAFVLVEGV